MRWTVPLALRKAENMKFAAVFTGMLALAALAAPVQASRLVSQSTHGMKRTCVYEVDGRSRLPGRRDRLTSVDVAIGEPCPSVYPDPRQREERIPISATLAAQRNTATATVCVYRYLGRNYLRELPRFQRCTLTPN